jgi:hypothetical protein
LDWSGTWKEIGESDGPKTGHVHVDGQGSCSSGSCLHLFGDGEQLSVGVSRPADTSFLDEAEVSYKVAYGYIETVDVGSAKLLVQVSSLEKGAWVTIDSYILGSESFGTEHPVVEVTSHLSSLFALRFVVSGLLSGEVYIDDVEIKGAYRETATTTTTTSKPTSTVESVATTIRSRSTTSTTRPEETTTTLAATTTTTTDRTTSTIAAAVTRLGNPPSPPQRRLGDAGTLRDTPNGIQTSFDGSLFGDVGAVPIFDKVDVGVDYNMAVEVVESSWAWMALLGVVIGWAIVTRIDRRRTPRPKA